MEEFSLFSMSIFLFLLVEMKDKGCWGKVALG